MTPYTLYKAITIRPISKQRLLKKRRKRNEVEVVFIIEYV